jgi:hypothetical protein
MLQAAVAAHSDRVMHTRYGLTRELTRRLTEQFIQGVENRCRGNVFVDAQATAIKGNLALLGNALIGNEHLRIAIGALHMNIPELVRRIITI